MKRTIIYVFGPKRLEQHYQNNEPLPDNVTGWLKIGLTTVDNDTVDKWDAAKKRVYYEVHTGIPETSVLLDVFEYPYVSGKPDDEVRDMMTNDVYSLANSKANNKLISNPYEIRAGQEFVYGASRKQILAAIAKFERDLVIKFKGKPELNRLIEMIEQNKLDVSDDQDAYKTTNSLLTASIDKFYDKLIKSLPQYIKSNSHYPGKNYLIVPSKHKNADYVLTFSVKRSITRVYFETHGGISEKDRFEQLIVENDIANKVIGLKETQQGVKKQDKYYWEVSGEYDGSEERVIEWFVKTTEAMYNVFEALL